MALFRVFLWMFVADIAPGDRVMFRGPHGLEFDEDTLETIIFRSIVYVFEAGETRSLLALAGHADGEITESINDFIFVMHPSMYRHLYQIGVKSFDRLAPFIITHLSCFLPLCDCTDVWLAAAASSSFLEFTQYMLISSMVFSFPNMFSVEPVPDQDLQPIIEQAFDLLDYRYLIVVSFVLSIHGKEMLQEQLPFL
jgi:hypothetical protein